MDKLEITPEHRWLHKFLGDWEYEGSFPGGPGNEGFSFKGSEHVRAVGDAWIQGEGSNDMGGENCTMIITLGYDTRRKAYVGTWIGSMMDHMFQYEGRVEPDGRTMVLESTGPCMMDPTKERKYRDITEFKTDDHRAFRAEMLGDDGTWSPMMSFDMYRVGSKPNG